MSTPVQQRELAFDYVKDNLVECCRELDKASHTGILNEGHVRHLARMCSFLPGSSRLPFAQDLVKTAAIKHIARNQS